METYDTAFSFDDLKAQLKKVMRTLFIVSAFVNLLLLTSSIYMLQVLDRVLSSGSLDTLLYLTLMALAALVIFGLLEMARRQMLHRVGYYFEQSLYTPLLSRIVRTSAQRDATHANDLVRLEDVRSFISGDNLIAFMDAPWTPFFLILITFINPWLGLISLIGILIIFAATLVYDRTARATTSVEKSNKSELVDHAKELTTIPVTGLALDLEGNISKKIRRGFLGLFESFLTSNDRLNAITAFSKFARFALQIALLGAGAWLAVLGEITAGGMIASSILLGRAVAPIERSISAWRAMLQAKQGWRVLKDSFENKEPAKQAVSVDDLEAKIELRDITIAYPGRAKPLIEGLNLTVDTGQICLIRGPSGCGKTSLARALLGVVAPAMGRVFIGGTDVMRIDATSKAKLVGYLPQGVDLLSGSIAQNVTRFEETPSAEALVEALKLSEATEFLSQFEDGVNQEINRSGAPLSGGQAQRIALARCLYRLPKIILLDEPTAYQDERFKEYFFRLLAALRDSGRTVVVISHDESLEEACDLVLLLGDGPWKLKARQLPENPIDGLARKIKAHRKKQADKTQSAEA